MARIPPATVQRILSLNLKEPEMRMALAGFLAAHLRNGGGSDEPALNQALSMFATRIHEVAGYAAHIVNSGSGEKH
jgi:hypothetical protein